MTGQQFIEETVESSFHAIPNTPDTCNISDKTLFTLLKNIFLISIFFT